MSERQSERGPDPADPSHDGAVPPPRPPAVPEPRQPARRRENRIRRLKELVRDANYDVPSDEVAASIIRDALFGAPDPDEPS